MSGRRREAAVTVGPLRRVMPSEQSDRSAASARRSPPSGMSRGSISGRGATRRSDPPTWSVIVNEAGIDPRAIGAIQITDRFSLVEVPDEVADEIIGTLRAATIKGRRVPVRRDRELNQGTE